MLFLWTDQACSYIRLCPYTKLRDDCTIYLAIGTPVLSVPDTCCNNRHAQLRVEWQLQDHGQLATSACATAVISGGAFLAASRGSRWISKSFMGEWNEGEIKHNSMLLLCTYLYTLWYYYLVRWLWLKRYDICKRSAYWREERKDLPPKSTSLEFDANHYTMYPLTIPSRYLACSCNIGKICNPIYPPCANIK